MKRKIILSLLILTGMINLIGCVTTDLKPNGFTEMKERDIQSLGKERKEKSKNISIQYFIVAKLKSVNEQPQEYLEFKSKRFSDRNECMNWVNENNNLITRSLQVHVTNRKKGYFVDNIKCLKTSMFSQVRASEAISV
ncbi:MAG: hypothetical protein CMM90_00925 [Rickettsiales bacterium]|nr:hypothetical protein [Rickettsiales bacterium]|tara:strand:- start:156 stop:569 length:414 start_codon:yes stop_codon:yes gene_type:complete